MMSTSIVSLMNVSVPFALRINAKRLKSGLLVAATGLTVNACAIAPEDRAGDSHPTGWDIDPIVVDDAGGSVDHERVAVIDSDAIFTGNIASEMAMPGEPDSAQPVDVAIVDDSPVQRRKKQPPQSRPVTKPVDIAAPSCAKPFSGQDETIALATTTSLKLRRAPSTSAQTLAVFSAGTTVTARKLTCGNWTQIVQGKRPIGYVYSYFLSAPK